MLALGWKGDLRLRRVLRTTKTACAITTATLVFCATVHGQQKPLTVDDAIRLARPITHRDASVHSVEIRARFGFVEYALLYEAPDSYEGLIAAGDPKFTYFAAAGSRAIAYDPRQGELLDITGLVPGIYCGGRNDDLYFGYTLSSSKEVDPSLLSQPGLLIDLPSILGSSNLTDRELQSLPGGKYRLVSATKKGTPLVATIDPSQGFAFTDIEIGTKLTGNFLEIHFNRVPPAVAPPIPSSRELRQSIAVREVPFTFAVGSTVVLLQALPPAALAPKPVALREGVQSPERRQVEESFRTFGGTVNWDRVDANLNRDIPKLREALPLP